MEITEEGKIEVKKEEIEEWLDNLEQMQLSLNNSIEAANNIVGKFCLMSKEIWLFKEKIAAGLSNAEKSEWISKQLSVATRRGNEKKMVG